VNGRPSRKGIAIASKYSALGARDQQQEADGAEQDEQQRPHLPAHIVAQSGDADVDVARLFAFEHIAELAVYCCKSGIAFADGDGGTDRRYALMSISSWSEITLLV
jgi:hypothetical protein